MTPVLIADLGNMGRNHALAHHHHPDAEIIAAALPMLGLRPPAEARILWIRNTLQLAEAECSAAFLGEHVVEEATDAFREIVGRTAACQQAFERTLNELAPHRT